MLPATIAPELTVSPVPLICVMVTVVTTNTPRWKLTADSASEALDVTTAVRLVAVTIAVLALSVPVEYIHRIAANDPASGVVSFVEFRTRCRSYPPPVIDNPDDDDEKLAQPQEYIGPASVTDPA